MDRPLPDFSNLRPEGVKRSSKRDRILNIFLRQEGHLSADDLFDLVRRVEPGIGRATVYRTLPARSILATADRVTSRRIDTRATST